MPDAALAASAGTIGGVADSAVLLQAAAVSGVQARLIDWRGPGWAWPDAVLLHTPWDYTAHLREFAAWVAAQSARTPMVNPLSVTEGNLHKSYLLDLAAAGIPVPVSRLLRAGDGVDVSDLRSTFGAGPVVAKPAVGAGGRRMSRLPDVAGVRSCDLVSPGGVVLEDLLLQEFLPAVQTAGEHALVVIAGQVSHLVHKVAAAGECRVHGFPRRHRAAGGPRRRDGRAGPVQSCRWSGTALRQGRLHRRPAAGPLVMELELTEPDLFLRHHRPAAHRLVEHVFRQWATSR